jgi:mono/diheme cytochrome c family protein
MKRRFLIVLGLCAALALVACGEAPAPTASGDATRGKQIFLTGGSSGIPCATCHTLDGTKLVGPSLQGIAERAAERVPGQSAEDYLRQSIDNPSAYMVEDYPDQMYKKYADTLSKQDLDDVVAYLMTQ